MPRIVGRHSPALRGAAAVACAVIHRSSLANAAETPLTPVTDLQGMD